MKFFLEVAENERIPKYYGYCWINPHKLTYTVAPIPFNRIARVLRRVQLFLKTGESSIELQAFRKGKKEGYREMKEIVQSMAGIHQISLEKILEEIKHI